MEEVSQLGCMDSGNKLQRQKKGTRNLGESKQGCLVYLPGGRRGRKDQVCFREIACWGKEGGEERHDRERERERGWGRERDQESCAGSSILRVFIPL